MIEWILERFCPKVYDSIFDKGVAKGRLDIAREMALVGKENHD